MQYWVSGMKRVKHACIPVLLTEDRLVRTRLPVPSLPTAPPQCNYMTDHIHSSCCNKEYHKVGKRAQQVRIRVKHIPEERGALSPKPNKDREWLGMLPLLLPRQAAKLLGLWGDIG